MRKREEKYDGNKIGARGALTVTGSGRLIRFSEDEGNVGGGRGEVGANAARVHVEDIRGIVLSTLPTQHPSFSLFSFPPRLEARGMRQTKELWRNCIRALRPQCCII